MELYKRKEGRVVVEAKQLQSDQNIKCSKSIEVDGNTKVEEYVMPAMAGDYLVNFGTNNIKLVSKQAFENNYEKVET